MTINSILGCILLILAAVGVPVLVCLAVMMRENDFVTFNLLWVKLEAWNSPVHINLPEAKRWGNGHWVQKRIDVTFSFFLSLSFHLDYLYYVFCVTFTTYLVFIFFIFSLCLFHSGTSFHVDQVLWPADLSFCSWSTIKQVSMSALYTATSQSPFVAALHMASSVTMPQARHTVFYLLLSSI